MNILLLSIRTPFSKTCDPLAFLFDSAFPIFLHTMSERSTVRPQPSDRDQPFEGDDINLRKPWPAQLTSAKYGSITPAQHSSGYAVHSSQLLQHHEPEGPQLGYVPLPHPDHIITFYNQPSYLVPLATLNSELEVDLAAWYWRKCPLARALGAGNVFSADRLLTLLTHFTRQDGSSPYRDHAMALLQLVCMRTLEGFETPTKYRSLQVHPRFYYELRLVLHHHRNHLAELLPQGEIGRFASWAAHQDDVTLKIQLAGGGSFKQRLSWHDACDPASTLISLPPLFRREAAISSPPLLAYAITEKKMAGISTNVRLQ